MTNLVCAICGTPIEVTYQFGKLCYIHAPISKLAGYKSYRCQAYNPEYEGTFACSNTKFAKASTVDKGEHIKLSGDAKKDIEKLENLIKQIKVDYEIEDEEKVNLDGIYYCKFCGYPVKRYPTDEEGLKDEWKHYDVISNEFRSWLCGGSSHYAEANQSKPVKGIVPLIEPKIEVSTTLTITYPSGRKFKEK